MGLSIVPCSRKRTPFRNRFCESQPAVPLYKVSLAAGRSNLANDQFVQIASPPCNITVTRYDRAAARENELREYADCYVFPYVNYVSIVVITSFVHRCRDSVCSKWVYRPFLALDNAHSSMHRFCKSGGSRKRVNGVCRLPCVPYVNYVSTVVITSFVHRS